MRFKIDFKSIKFRVWLSFLIFAVIIVGFMWFLQIFFMNNYYEYMKTKTATDTAAQLASDYKTDDQESFFASVTEASRDNDIYIQVEQSGLIIYPQDPSDYEYGKYVTRTKSLLSKSKLQSVSRTIHTGQGKNNILIYAKYLDEDSETIMYMVTPLYPMASTKKIIRSQLVYIMIISLALAFILSFYLSDRISRPIRNITKSARRLGDGDYGAVFHSRGEYTEIQNLTDSLNKTSFELQKTSNLQRDLMSNVSHDLRTPLTMIKSYAEMIRDLSGDDPVKREKHLNTIIEEADRLNVFVNDLLELSRMQSGTAQLHLTDFDICETTRQLMEPYHVLELQDGYSIEYNHPDVQYVNADRDKINRVISNLLSNAVKYCGADKKIIVNIKHWGPTIHMEFIDHGIGIKPEELQSIWDRYYQTSSHHVRSSTGSGLGLSIVKQILQLHNAKFGVESKVGRGTTFWFELPAAEPPEEQ
ncbi:MAG: sensor histidine kinase [Anaerovoracaceae bacterium]